MAYDGEEMIARFDNYLPDIEEADVYIQDLRRGIVYRTKSGGKCEIGHVLDSVDDKFIGFTHGMRTVRSLRQVLNFDGGNYYNLGQVGVFCLTDSLGLNPTMKELKFNLVD